MATTRPTLSKLTRLDETRHGIEQWRRTRRHRNTPMPAALWNAAVAAARQHGLYPTARALRVDYGALKTHLEASDARPALPMPTFVELTSAAPVTLGDSIGCVIEIEAGSGTRRLRLSGLVPDALMVLARMAWSEGR